MPMKDRIPIHIHYDLVNASTPPVSKSKPLARMLPSQSNLEKVIAEAHSNYYDCVCIPITTDEWRKRWSRLCLTNPESSPTSVQHKSPEELLKQQQDAELWRASDAFSLSEVNITKLEEAENVIGLVSDWLELDSPDEWVRLDSELALRQELSYASYLNIASVILPPPRNRQHAVDYARAINGCLNNSGILNPYMHLSVRIPLYDSAVASPSMNMTGSPYINVEPGDRPDSPTEAAFASAHIGGTPKKSYEEDMNASWEMWDVIRTICEYNPRLGMTLDLSVPVQASPGALSRWNSENLKHVFFPSSSFVSNKGGYPVLPKATQAFIRDIIKHRPSFILSGTADGLHKTGGESAYHQYLRYLERSSPSVIALDNELSVENFASGYWDYLQAPLQPLMDNLQMTTYEVFERDPVKYQKYEQAIYLALCDRPADSRTVLCVAGAGRGPLVSRCLKAITRSSRKAIIYVVEKNPSAFVTLQEKCNSEWGPEVELLFGDMRSIPVPEKADILISELLGSFGDNELSPECLDGAMRFLKDNGISIPSSYTAHLSPMSSSKLYHEANAMGSKNAETPYVVIFRAVNQLSVAPQECWEFEHPRKDATLDSNGLPYTNSHNTRSAHLTFQIPHAGELHGLAGYFEACLYGDVGLSIHPLRKDRISPNMLSWFPIFFPFKEPLYLPAGAELDVAIWRLTDKKKVWYEWFAESYLRIPKTLNPHSHNTNASPENMSALLPSPLADAPMTGWHASTPESELPGHSGLTGEVRTKIGQTALHNPGGRGSWIGL
ncbi:methyltransferase protein [Tulasnella sp. 418]|nr:methyltransferase protein [Tulasnella sp. 418]